MAGVTFLAATGVVPCRQPLQASALNVERTVAAAAHRIPHIRKQGVCRASGQLQQVSSALSAGVRTTGVTRLNATTKLYCMAPDAAQRLEREAEASVVKAELLAEKTKRAAELAGATPQCAVLL